MSHSTILLPQRLMRLAVFHAQALEALEVLLAAELGVSTATISNALTGKGRMKEETRRHIREAALSMGYEMPVAGRVQKGQMIVIAEAAEVTFTAETICGISLAALDRELHQGSTGQACLHHLCITVSASSARPVEQAEHPLRGGVLLWHRRSSLG